MGSIRIWSLGRHRGRGRRVVVHQRPVAPTDAGRTAVPAASVAGASGWAGSALSPAPGPRGPGVPAAASEGNARVTGLPDFSALVAQNGAAVVNISVRREAATSGA